MTPIIKIMRTLEELEEETKRFAHALECFGGGAPSPRGATLVTLSGELGAGKTAFVKGVARAFGITEIVNSPTFVLEKIYLIQEFAKGQFAKGSPSVIPKDSPPRIPPRKFKRLIHIDAYRLEKGSDLGPLGFDEIMQDAENLIMLEWPEKVADALPIPAHKLFLATSPITDGSHSHTISYE